MNAPLGQKQIMRAELASDVADIALDDGQALRRVFGRFGTGVTIVTAQSEQGPLAMTANSFSSVSLAPPLVLWSAACGSKRHNVFAQADQFCIHVLAEEQRELALHFATQGHDFSRVDWVAGPTGAPALSGTLAQFHCKQFAVHEAGDHSIIVGEVTHARLNREGRAGLMFSGGTFGAFNAFDD